MERDEHVFAYVMDELENGVKNEALWIKAYANSAGNDSKVEPLYIQYRVEEIKSVFKNYNIDYTECSKDKINEYIENDFKDELTPEWMRKLWKWADQNNIPDLEFWHDDYKDKYLYEHGLARTMNKLINQLELKIEDKDVTILPKEIGNLENLEKLFIRDTNISELPKEIGNLVNLNEVKFNYEKIKEFPKQVENLRSLNELSIAWGGFESLPKGIGNFKNLTSLSVVHTEIKTVPEEIGNLINLEELTLGDNSNLKWLPKEIGNLSKLQILDFSAYAGSGMHSFTILDSFPEEIENLKNLKTMYIDYDNKNILPSGLFDIPRLRITVPGDYPHKGWVIKEEN